jgi:uncharacterized membrane protein YfcA
MSHQVDGLGPLLLVVGVIGVSAVVQVVTGFGFALVCVPLLALVVDAHTAVVLALLLGVLVALQQAAAGRGHLDRGVVTRLLGGAAAGLPLGLYAFTHTSARTLTVGIGAMILLTTVLLTRGFTLRRRSPSLDLGLGVLTGFLTTSTGTPGPPLVAVLQARGVTPEVFRATTSLVFATMDLLAVVSFALHGDLTGPLLVVALTTLPGMALGAWIGTQVRPLLSAGTFRVVVLVLLAVAGVSAIATAVL